MSRLLNQHAAVIAVLMPAIVLQAQAQQSHAQQGILRKESDHQTDRIRDRLWIWGHPAGVYNDSYLAPLGRQSTIEPVAAADRLGIRNMIFVRYSASLSPEQLHTLGERRYHGGKLPITAVVYVRQISPWLKPYLDEVGQVSLWTWRPADLDRLPENLAALEKLIPGKPVLLGCYMIDAIMGETHGRAAEGAERAGELPAF
jgi:hypothetical protein